MEFKPNYPLFDPSTISAPVRFRAREVARVTDLAEGDALAPFCNETEPRVIAEIVAHPTGVEFMYTDGRKECYSLNCVVELAD